MAVALRYFTNLIGTPAFQHNRIDVAEFMHESIVFLLRVRCRRKESSRSLSHLLMSFLYNLFVIFVYIVCGFQILLSVYFMTAFCASM